MAKKNSGGNLDPARAKAQAMRESQQKADKRTRNIIIGVVSVIIVAIVAALIVVVLSQSKPSTNPDGTTGVPSSFSNGEPIVVSHLGVGQKDDSLQDLTLNFSYTCHWCAYLETRVGEDLTNDAAAGKYNLILQPVNTAYMEFQGPATNAALVVAANDPEKFVAFHQAMMAYVDEAVNVNQDLTVVQSLPLSTEKVAELARAAGVSDDVVSQFGKSAEEYLTLTTTNWSGETFEGRVEGSVGTPELVFANTVVPWGQGTPEEIYAQILQGMEGLGLTAK